MQLANRLIAVATLVAGSMAAQAASQEAARLVPDTLPVARNEGDLKLTFTKLEAIPPPPGPPTDDPDKASWTRVSFQFDWRGRPMREWSTQSIVVTDAAGQTYSPKRTSTYLSNKGEGSVSFSGPVWATGRPWNVRLGLARTSPIQSYEFWNTYNPDEIVTVRGLPVPAPGEVLTSGRVAEAQGAKVQLLGITGGNTKLPDGLPVLYPHPTLHWRVERPKDTHVTFLRATDAAGRVIKPQGAASGTGVGGERYARELEVPAGVREIFVAFGVHKTRYFELTAIPGP